VTDFADVTGHPGELLSALLDGELSAEEAELVHAHVVGCASCTAELDAVRHVRSAVRSLKAVDPPAGFVESLLEDVQPAPSNVIPLRARRAAIANAAAAVAAGLLILAGVGEGSAAAVSPEVTGSVERHAATISAVTAGLGGPSPIVAPEEVTPTTEPSRSTRVPHPYTAPSELGDYQLVQAFDAPHGVHLL
jgi:anti-sigma factor RsiW